MLHSELRLNVSMSPSLILEVHPTAIGLFIPPIPLCLLEPLLLLVLGSSGHTLLINLGIEGIAFAYCYLKMVLKFLLFFVFFRLVL